jgi:hypothetical protein
MRLRIRQAQSSELDKLFLAGLADEAWIGKQRNIINQWIGKDRQWIEQKWDK